MKGALHLCVNGEVLNELHNSLCEESEDNMKTSMKTHNTHTQCDITPELKPKIRFVL